MAFKIIKETDNFVHYKVSEPSPLSTGIMREQKFLCIGGPFNGVKVTHTLLSEEKLFYYASHTVEKPGYTRYNCAQSNRYGEAPKCIWFWVS